MVAMNAGMANDKRCTEAVDKQVTAAMWDQAMRSEEQKERTEESSPARVGESNNSTIVQK